MPTGTVLVTGASSGIGAVYADRFAARGHDLILTSRRTDRLEAAAKTLTARHGVAVRTVAADLAARTVAADLAARDGLARVEALLADDPAITHLVNNAGVASVEPLAVTPADEMERMIAVNVTAPVRLARAAAQALAGRGAGTIINVSSIVAIAPEQLSAVYSGSKAFVLAFSQRLRVELEGAGVRLQVVLPGATRTDLWEPAGGADTLPAAILMSAEDLVDAALLGLDRGEFATIPSLQDGGEWEAWEAARLAMLPHLSNARVAPRYRPEAPA